MRRAAYVVLWVVLAGFAWLRLGSAGHDVLWAEDGRDFLGGALEGASPLQPYAGYLHLVPRLLALGLVHLVPLREYAVALTAACCLVAGAVGVLVLVVTRSLGLSWPARLGLAVLTVAAPPMLAEVLGNSANLHSLFLWLAPWLFLARPRRWSSAWLLGVTALVTGLTEIQMVLFAPLLAMWWRDRKRLPLTGGVLLAAAAQLIATVLHRRHHESTTQQFKDPLSYADGYLHHAVGGAWTAPVTRIGSLIVDHGWWTVWLLAVPFATAAVVGLLLGGPFRWLPAALVVASVLLWVVAVTVNGGMPYRPVVTPGESLAAVGLLRWAVVPAMLLLASLVLVADRLGRLAMADSARVALLPAAAAGLLALAVAAAAASALTGGDKPIKTVFGRHWSEDLGRARAGCDAGLSAVRVPITPEGWSVVVPCERLGATP